MASTRYTSSHSAAWGSALSLLLLLLQSCAARTSTSPSFRRRLIAGGTFADEQEYPFMASIQKANGPHFCGGSILNDEWILTAAHCVHGLEAKDLTISVGHVHREEGNFHTVRSIFAHPDYNPADSAMDIAVLRLHNKMELGPHTQPIPLMDTKLETSALTAAGWGAVFAEDTTGSTLLKEVRLKLGTKEECNKALWALGGGTHNLANLLCMGGRQTKTSVCQGDSGGPSVLKMGGQWTQAGVVSFGSKDCDQPGNWEFASRVSRFLGWISKTTGLSKRQLTTSKLPKKQAKSTGKRETSPANAGVETMAKVVKVGPNAAGKRSGKNMSKAGRRSTKKSLKASRGRESRGKRKQAKKDEGTLTLSFAPTPTPVSSISPTTVPTIRPTPTPAALYTPMLPTHPKLPPTPQLAAFSESKEVPVMLGDQPVNVYETYDDEYDYEDDEKVAMGITQLPLQLLDGPFVPDYGTPGAAMNFAKSMGAHSYGVPFLQLAYGGHDQLNFPVFVGF